jgi:Zn-dependent protease with chaperone function
VAVVDITPSPTFRAQTLRAIAAVLGFMLTYLLLLVAAVLLTLATLYGAMHIILFRPGTATILIGAGVASLGILVLVFLVKFIFSSSSSESGNRVAVTAREEPALFAMIEELVREVGTQRPKRVYLSTEVNASVFYDSSFWSMFLPVKKNLVIGLGLMNTVTVTELRAILAHEFGHFSQRTMVVGSYVYTANRVIYNMLYENEGYDRMIQGWSEVNGILSLFVWIAVQVVGAIQWVLMQVYKLVNRQYLALSREMEFHADEVAAHVTGYEPLASSLLRMDLAQESLTGVINFYSSRIGDNERSEDVYGEQRLLLGMLADKAGVKCRDPFPTVELADQSRFDSSKLVMNEQWASHPSTEDRVQRLRQTGRQGASHANDTPAIDLLNDPAQRKRQLTDLVFREVTFAKEPRTLSPTEFAAAMKEQLHQHELPPAYRGYYDSHTPLPCAEEQPADRPERFTSSFDELFSPERVAIPHELAILTQDIQVLQQIQAGEIDLRTFDYDGEKYRQKDAARLIEQLRAHGQELGQRLRAQDWQVRDYFEARERESDQSPKLQQHYENLCMADRKRQDRQANHDAIIGGLQFLSENISVEEAHAHFDRLLPHEEMLREEVREYLSDPLPQESIHTTMRADLSQYTEKPTKYLVYQELRQDQLQLLFRVLDYVSYLRDQFVFRYKQKLLTYQLELAAPVRISE